MVRGGRRLPAAGAGWFWSPGIFVARDACSIPSRILAFPDGAGRFELGASRLGICGSGARLAQGFPSQDAHEIQGEGGCDSDGVDGGNRSLWGGGC